MHLVSLEGDRLLAVHLGLFTLEYRTQGEQFRKNAPHGPHVDGGGIVMTSQDELGCSVPDRNDDLVATKQRVQGLVEASGQTQISNLDLTSRGHHDVRGLQVTMEHPVRMEVLAPIKKLEHNTLDHAG